MRLQGIFAIQRILTILILIAILSVPVSAAVTTTFGVNDSVLVNRTDVMDTSKAVPMNIWELAILVSLALVIISFIRFPIGEEILVAIMAVPPAWYAYLSAYNIDQLAVSDIVTVAGGYQIIEKHTIYHFDDLALFILLPFAVFTMLNAFRIFLNYRAIKQASKFEEKIDTAEGGEDIDRM